MIMDDRQRGATLVEFALVAPALLLFGLGIWQSVLLYQGRTVLNVAVFEAARVGAVEHASVEQMTDELAYRLAPLAGGDGSAEGVSSAIADSLLARRTDPLHARIDVISPGQAAFDDFGEIDPLSGQLAIPNSHLRHRERGSGPRSGLSIQDANLLVVEATHGYRPTVPLFGALLTESLAVLDPERSHYYRQGLMPLTARATVRMQSDAWASAILPDTSLVVATASGAGGDAVAPSSGRIPLGESPVNSTGSATGNASGTLSAGLPTNGMQCDPVTGLPVDLPLLESSPLPDGECSEFGDAIAYRRLERQRDAVLAAGC